MRKLILALIIGLLPLTVSAQGTVTMRMAVPTGSTVTIMKDYISHRPTLVPDDFFDTPLNPDRYGVLEIKFPQENTQSFLVKVEKQGYRTLIGCFATECDSEFRVELPVAGKDTSPIDTQEMWDKACDLHNSGFAPRSRLRKAHKLFLKAAKLGNVRAMYSVAISFHDGSGCARNDNKAHYWRKMAEKMGMIFH